MIEEEFTKLQESLKRGKILELKKIKKESLLEFIEELEIRIKSREKKIAEELETARLSNENYDGLQKTLDEHQEFIKELKDLNSKLHEEVSDLEEENKVLKNKYDALSLIEINDLLNLETAEDLKVLSNTLEELEKEFNIKNKKDYYLGSIAPDIAK